MTEENFISLIDALKKQKEYDETCSRKLKDVFGEYVSYNNDYLVDSIIDFLVQELNDKSEWITYYIFELDFGELNYRLKVHENGKEIPLKTAEDLWNILH